MSFQSDSPLSFASTAALQGYSLADDDIRLEDPYLPRELYVKAIREAAAADPNKPFVMLRSPPCTGKTALATLLMDHLIRDGHRVNRFIAKHVQGSEGRLFEQLREQTGLDVFNPLKFQNLVRACPDRDAEFWLIVDDAETVFPEAYNALWSTLVKHFLASFPDDTVRRRLRFVFASTYVRHSTEKTPVDLRLLASVPAEGEQLTINAEEAAFLFSTFGRGRAWAQWEQAFAHLKGISNGHIGVFTRGLIFLNALTGKTNPGLIEAVAVERLRSHAFLERLGERCFSGRFKDETRLLLTQLHPEADTAPNAELLPVFRDLLRAGVLKTGGGFHSVAAESFYYNELFPNRGLMVPNSLEHMVLSVVKNLSTSRLLAARNVVSEGAASGPSGSCSGGSTGGGRAAAAPAAAAATAFHFPKEAAFQQLFHEGMARQLPSKYIIRPEHDTCVVDADGTIQSGELDFYINGELQWALELLRQGDKIGQHLARFEPCTAKYRGVQPLAYLVVDCRGPFSKMLAKHPNRCSLFFDDDFKMCTVQMCEETETRPPIQLQP